MGGAEVGDALPGQVADESADDAREKSADGVDPSLVDLKANASGEEPVGIKDEATVGETPDAADNEDGNGLDGTKTSSETAPEQGHDSKMDGGGTTAEGGVEVANGGFENDNVYRRIRESALEVINAVRCCMVLVQE